MPLANNRFRAMKHDQYVICLASVDPRRSMGGLGRYFRDALAMLKERGVSMLCCFPFPTKRSKRLNRHLSNFWGTVVDEHLVGFYGVRDIWGMLAELGRSGRRPVEIQIHQLQSFALDYVADFLAAVPVPVKLFLHDYYTICPGAHLLKNGKTYCGSEKPSAEKCSGCTKWTPPHHAKIHSLLESVRERLTVVAPSAAARDVWLQTFVDFREQTIVIPHLRAEGEVPNAYQQKAEDEPIRMAYVGAPAAYKGWNLFRQLATSLGGSDKNFEFYHFGVNNPDGSIIRNVPVSFVEDGLEAMTSSIRRTNIDVVLLWALSPETYSYTLYESMQANVMVLTNPDSGNIADVVESQRVGRVFRTEKELWAYLQNVEQVRRDVDFYRRSRPLLPLRLVPNPAIPDALDLSANPRLPPVELVPHHAWHVEWLYTLKQLKQKMVGS